MDKKENFNNIQRAAKQVLPLIRQGISPDPETLTSVMANNHLQLGDTPEVFKRAMLYFYDECDRRAEIIDPVEKLVANFGPRVNLEVAYWRMKLHYRKYRHS